MAPPSPFPGRTPNSKAPHSTPSKVSAFHALQSDGDSDGSDCSTVPAPETPSTATPSPSCCGDSSVEFIVENGEDDVGEWSTAPSRRKPRAAPRPPLPRATEENPREKPMPKDEWETHEADSEWLVRKGQRHAHTKAQKQEWNFKSKKRTAYAQQKRDDQRGASLGGLVEEDEF